MTDYRLRSPAWMRATARAVLLTFSTASLVACGGGASEPPATDATHAQAAPQETATTLPAAPEPPPPPAAAAPPPTLPAQPPQTLGKDELRELVAPVALYPDVVLASLLPATTFPDQVHDAAQYVGQAAQVDAIPQDRGWDGSVTALLQFPDVVRWLDANPAWTDEMGQAVTFQQADVLQAIQDYRHQVANAGNLKTNQYQKVRTVADRDIVIEPARPDVVYVPSYDPVAAVQPQPVIVQESSPGINPWIAFGGGALVGALGAWALYSIFDDDNVRVTNNYYGGRRIRGYDNYYYNRGRRPPGAAWNPRPRPWRRANDDWRRTQRLRYASAQPNRRARALRPPLQATTAQAPTPAQVRKQQRQEAQQLQRQQKQVQQQQRQEQKQAQQTQKQQRQAQQREQRQQKQAAQQQRQQQQRQQKQAAQQQRQQQQRDQRQQKQAAQQQRQAQQREQRQQKQAAQQQRQQAQREQRQQQQQQRQAQRTQQQQQRQENRQQRQEQRQEKKGGGGGGGNKNNKKKSND
ncbi:MAG: DUF3300 domain-containing protein [bacterium]|nr:DUF3300 domain-containing protein [bacterium]